MRFLPFRFVLLHQVIGGCRGEDDDLLAGVGEIAVGVGVEETSAVERA